MCRIHVCLYLCTAYMFVCTAYTCTLMYVQHIRMYICMYCICVCMYVLCTCMLVSIYHHIASSVACLTTSRVAQTCSKRTHSIVREHILLLLSHALLHHVLHKHVKINVHLLDTHQLSLTRCMHTEHTQINTHTHTVCVCVCVCVRA